MRAFLWALLIVALAAPSLARDGSGLIRPAPPISRNPPAPLYPHFPEIHFAPLPDAKPAEPLPPTPTGARPAPRPAATPALPPPALPEERVLNLASEIAVSKDGTVAVTETVTIRTAGKDWRGIAPEFPIRAADSSGKKIHSAFAVESVEFDGHGVPYTIFNSYSTDNAKRLFIVNAEPLKGDHTYRIVYKTDRRVEFLDGRDRFSWNVTGVEWGRPIEHAQAVVHLPDGAHILASDVLTGTQKSPTHTGSFEILGSGIRVYTNGPLANGESLRFTADINKGVILPPGGFQSYLNYARDNAVSTAAVGGLLVLCLYYLSAWFLLGCDPLRGPLQPLFVPPENLSAAEMRYIRRMSYDHKCFAVAIAGMAAKGFLTIRNDDNTYVLTRTGQTEREAGLTDAELLVANVLFRDGNTIALDKAHAGITNQALAQLESYLSQDYDNRYFVSNRMWFYGGVAILAASAFAAYWFADTTDTAVWVVLYMLLWTGGIATVLHLMGGRWSFIFALMAPRYVLGIGLIVYTYYHLSQYTSDDGEPFGGRVPAIAVAAFIAQCLVAIAFYFLLQSRTIQGSRIRDKIDAFKRFLDSDKEPATAPPVTAKLFEQFLPYAIALDAENSWSRKFAADAARQGKPLDDSYRPSWYLGGPFRLFGSVFTWNFGNSLTDATRAGPAASGGRKA